jgi:hypothetical protein
MAHLTNNSRGAFVNVSDSRGKQSFVIDDTFVRARRGLSLQQATRAGVSSPPLSRHRKFGNPLRQPINHSAPFLLALPASKIFHFRAPITYAPSISCSNSSSLRDCFEHTVEAKLVSLRLPFEWMPSPVNF